MKMHDATSLALRCCLFIGVAVLAIGLLLSGGDHGNDIMWTGVLILIASPFAGVLVTCIYLIAEKDWKWAKVAIVLIALITAFLAISLLWK
ncbi:MAG: DUF1634 domain-containing protein [Methanomassiliicoccaceae archaeon]|nr:DUF1634 domain-containing protein [Methanomassiliicoccaceae archaeon]